MSATGIFPYVDRHVPRDKTCLDTLPVWSPKGLVTALTSSRLEHLKIDTCGTFIKSPNECVCLGLASKIPSLRSVWLRMHAICPRILQFDEYHKKVNNPPPRIEKIVICLFSVRKDSGYPWLSRHFEPQLMYEHLSGQLVRNAEAAIRTIPLHEIVVDRRVRRKRRYRRSFKSTGSGIRQ